MHIVIFECSGLQIGTLLHAHVLFQQENVLYRTPPIPSQKRDVPHLLLLK